MSIKEMLKLTNDSTAESLWRNNVVACAFDYANFIWKPTAQNVYHGHDKEDVLVNTPDVNYSSSKYQCGWWCVNKENQGIPYNWGGCCTIQEFKDAITEGKFAGNVPDSRDNGTSKYCVGVDCSGLLTVCWGLSKKLSTRSVPTLASPLETTDLLLPADVLLIPVSHVMIFIDFTDNTKTYARIVDSSRTTGRVLLRIVQISELSNKGYIGYRMIKID